MWLIFQSLTVPLQSSGFLNKNYLFIFGCARSLLCLYRLFFLVAASGGYSPLWCGGFSHWGAQAVGVWAEVTVGYGLSICGLWALEHWLCSCGTWLEQLHGTWNLCGPGIKPLSSVLGGGSYSLPYQGSSAVVDFKLIK